MSLIGCVSGRLGGAGAAPLEGVVTLIFLGMGVVATIAFVVCVLARPRVYTASSVIIGLANTAALAFAAHQAHTHAAREYQFLYVLDPQGRPLSGTAVRYEVYGYGRGGTRPSSPTVRRGPVLSDESGLVRLDSRAMRHEVEAVVSKSGYRDVAFNLGMQYGKWWPARSLQVTVPSSGLTASASVPCVKPLAFSIYLSPASEAPGPLVYTHAEIAGVAPYKCFLDVETGQFNGSEPSGDVEFDLTLEKEGPRERPRLRVTACTGGGIQLVPYAVSLSGRLSPYEHVYNIAPTSGYVSSLEVPLQSSPGPTLYVRSRNGALYARMELDALMTGDDSWVKTRANLAVNPSGSRSLEGFRFSSHPKITKAVIGDAAF
jgi:hypothetical protein